MPLVQRQVLAVEAREQLVETPASASEARAALHLYPVHRLFMPVVVGDLVSPVVRVVEDLVATVPPLAPPILAEAVEVLAIT